MASTVVPLPLDPGLVLPALVLSAPVDAVLDDAEPAELVGAPVLLAPEPLLELLPQADRLATTRTADTAVTVPLWPS